jgi:hypothetical protein
MIVEPRQPPRSFCVGVSQSIEIKDCGTVQLDFDEQVTFVTETGSEYDVVRKDWGYYATPSLNGRLPQHGLRPALMANAAGRYYIVLVEVGREERFAEYVAEEKQRVVRWLDVDDAFDL